MVKQQKIVLMVAGFVGALVAAVLLIGTVAEVSAQGPGPGGRGGRPGIGRGMFGPGGLGLEGVNLTDAQRDTVKGIVDSHREETQALFERVTQARRALSASADAGRVDESQAAEVGSATAALALAEAKVRAEVLQILTPEQRAEITRRAAERELRFAERTRKGRQ